MIKTEPNLRNISQLNSLNIIWTQYGSIESYFSTKYLHQTPVQVSPYSILFGQTDQLFIQSTTYGGGAQQSWQLRSFEIIGGISFNDIKIKGKNAANSCSKMDNMVLNPAGDFSKEAMGVFIWGKMYMDSACYSTMMYMSNVAKDAKWYIQSSETTINRLQI